MLPDRELRFDRGHPIGLPGPDGEDEGKSGVIEGDEPAGAFRDRGSARDGASARFGVGGLPVQRPERVETIPGFSRDLR